MKKLFLVVLTVAGLQVVQAQSNDSVCIVLTKLLNLADKNKLGDLIGVALSTDDRFHITTYNSTTAFPGFDHNELFDISKDGHNSFTAYRLFDDEAAMKGMKSSLKEKLQSCLKASKQKFELNDNGDKYPVWWQYKKAKLSIESYHSGEQFVLKVEVQNIHY